jgi:hypothetical protein
MMLIHIALGAEQLRQVDAAAGRAAEGVVGQADKLV